jgi:hypothetical protein
MHAWCNVTPALPWKGAWLGGARVAAGIDGTVTLRATAAEPISHESALT